jgi:sugar lactone lactonase YvrE
MSHDWDVLATGYQLAEAPTIDTDGSLLFSDVLGGGVYRLDPRGEVTTVVPKRRGVGGLSLHADGGVVCSGRDIVHVREGDTRTVLHVDGVAGWNDLCTDKAGRVYAGALRFAVFDRDAEEIPGELWRVAFEGGPAALFDGVVHANGVALSPDEQTIYLSDTRARVVIAYDFARETRRAFDMAAHGLPDGMAIDEEGAIWLALVGGGIGRFRPDGTLDRKLDIPSEFVSSCCLDGRDLYVTTGTPTASVLRTTVAVAGVPVARARV